MAIVLNGSTGITDADGGTVLSTADLASQAEAEAGTDNTKLMTPLRVEQAVAAIPVTEIGVGQTWQSFTGSRAASTSYQNLTGRPIMVAINTSNNTSPIQVSVNNSTWVTIGSSGGSVLGTVTMIVPNNHYYRINGAGTITSWSELR